MSPQPRTENPLALEEAIEVVLQRVPRGIELLPAREEARQVEEEDVLHSRLREAERRDGRRVELPGADLLPGP